MSMPNGGDDLTGSPELFASNLLIVRAIEHGMTGVTIRRENDGIIVQNEHPDREYDKETLTEDTGIWSDIVERFRSMTVEREDASTDRLKPKTPATEQVESIEIRYPDEETIELTFQHAG
jgi:hypothetical protein